MSILEKVEIKETRIRYPTKVNVSMECSENPVFGLGFSETKEHSLNISISCNFKANDAQLNQAKIMALEYINNEIYGEVLHRLAALTHAIYNDDRDFALSEIASIKESLKIK